MQIEEIIHFLKKTIEPLDSEIYGKGYRASVYLTDGTFLPCVMFRNPGMHIKLAIKRFKEEKSGNGIFNKGSGIGYYRIVENFVANGNRINYYDVDKIEISKNAFPSSILRQIQGETTMGWTGFAVKMTDGRYFGFGTTFHADFFQMPDGYEMTDIVEVINHSYVLKNGELHSHKETLITRPDNYKDAIIYRERPYFECFIDNL